MMRGYKFHFSLLIWIHIFKAVKCLKEDCSYFDDHKRLGKCYEEYMKFFNISHNEITYDRYIEETNHSFSSVNSMNQLCDKFVSLKKCIGTKIIKNCINLEDFEYIFMNLDHQKMEQLQYVINFYQFDYICDAGFKGYTESFNCINNMKIKCNDGYGTTCGEAKAGIECSSKKAENECGNNGFDYVQNIFSIGLCYSKPECIEFCKHQIAREARNASNK